jgi:hypothetical protein
VSISRRYIETVSEQCDAPEIVLACLQPEIDKLREKERERKIQRRGNRQPTGNPKGRPALSPEKASQSKERRRAYMRELMRRKRMEALAKNSGAPDGETT